MPKTYQTQIVSYLQSNFKPGFNVFDIQQEVGSVVGFLALYDDLPPELIRLAQDQYAALIAAIGTIRLGIDLLRSTGRNDYLGPTAHSLKMAWTLIEKLPDQVPSTSHDLAFIADPLLQEMIGLDVSAATTDLHSGEWKGATIIAGSCCEALLLYGLQTRDGKTPGSVAGAVAAISWKRKAPHLVDLTDMSWNLFAYTTVAHHLRLISDGTKAELGPARDYRNLIHPAKTVRQGCDAIGAPLM